MSRKKELAKNTIILAFGKICTQFVNFLLLPLYTLLLSPAEYGVFDLFNTYIALLVPLFNWQFETGMFRFMIDCRNNKEKKTELVSTVIISNVFQAVSYLIIYVVISRFITSKYKIFLAIDVVLNIFLNTLLQFPRGVGDNKTYSLGSFVSATSTMVFNVILIAGFKMGAYGLFIGTVLGKIITILFLIYKNKIWNYFCFKLASMDVFKKLCKYSIPLIPNQLSWWVVGVSDRTIISKIIGVSANGIYSVANKFSTIYITIYNIFNLSWTESVSIHINDDDCNDYLGETINSMYCLFSSICFGIIAVMPFAFEVLVGKEYINAYYQIPILMIAVFFQSIVGLYSVIYVALKKSVEIAKTSFYAAVVNIIINILFIKKIGLYAASISTLLSYFTMAIYRYFHVKKYINIPLKSKYVLTSLVVGSFSVIFYYLNNKMFNIFSLLMVIVYTIIFNRDFLLDSLNTIIKLIKR